MSHSTESIWSACSSQLKAFIVKRTSDPSIADDILQDVFIKIHENIDSLRDDTKICGWAYHIANNCIIDYYRRHKVEPSKSYIQPDQELGVYEDEEGSVVNEHTEIIASGLPSMISTLPAKYAEALTMVELQGLSQVQLAKQLNLSLSGAKSRVQRGRQLLKDSLMSCCHYEFDRYGTIISSHPIKCCCCHQYYKDKASKG